MAMAPGMKMASSAPCDTVPTTSQQKAAVSMVDTSWQDAKKYQSLAVAKAAGYVPVTPTVRRSCTTSASPRTGPPCWAARS